MRRLTAASGTLATLLLVAACGGAASPSPASVAPSTGASAPASVEASASAPASAEASAPASVAPSVALPSFSLPSEAKDLEALLPDKLCGAATTKASMSGASFMASADETFKAALAALGKQASDVSFAFAFTTGECGAGIFRIKGVDQGALEQALLAEQQKAGNAYTQGNVGGKNVYISAETSGKQYVYFAGDAVIFAQAKDDATAATILQQLP